MASSKNGHNRYLRRNTSLSMSSFSFSDPEEDSSSAFDNVVGNSNQYYTNYHFQQRKKQLGRIQDELVKILAANRLIDQQQQNPEKRNLYYYQQPRVKHHSGGSGSGGNGNGNGAGGKKIWKKITNKLGKYSSGGSTSGGSKEEKEESGGAIKPAKIFLDPWRRYSLDRPAADAAGGGGKFDKGLSPNNRRRQTAYEKGDPEMRKRSNSEVTRFKVLSLHGGGDTADFAVTGPSKLADASALCQEYFSRLTCYDAVPQCTAVIAADTKTQVCQVFDIFCENNISSVLVWDSSAHRVVNLCRVDDLVCHLWNNGKLFDVQGEFSRPLLEICPDASALCAPADTSLIDAATFMCDLSNPCTVRQGKRLALLNETTRDVVHLLSAWDILHFFSEQMSKFQAAHTAFDRTLGSILECQSDEYRRVRTLTETEPLADVIGLLAGKGGGALVSSYHYGTGQQTRLATVTFLDIIQFVVNELGSWDEADGTNKRLGHVIHYHEQKRSLVYPSNTPLFAVLNDWLPSMSSDAVVVVVDEATGQNVVGLLEPEHLLHALLSYQNDSNSYERSGSPFRSVKL